MNENWITSLGLTSNVNASDLLVAAQQDKYVCSKFDSCYVTGKDAMDMLLMNVLSLQNLADTAHMQSSDFSLYEHSHDNLYNKLSLDLEYASQKTASSTQFKSLSSYVTATNVIDNDDAVSVGNIFIDGALIPLEIPLTCVNNSRKISFEVIEPAVGSLKFIAMKSISTNNQIRYKSDDFDGWLYPDGSTFNLSDFALSTQLKKLYGSSNTTFTLPDFRRFMRMNGKNEKQNLKATGIVGKKNVLKKHTHSIDIRGTAEIDFVLIVVGNDSEGKGGTFHHGEGNININSSAKIKFKDPSTGNVKTYAGLEKLLTKEIRNEFNIVKYSFNTGTFYKAKYDDLMRFLKEVDKYNDSHTYDQFIEFDKLQLNPLPSMKVFATFTNMSDMTINSAEGDSSGETYPSHVILPVMVYVGQRKRDLT